jgi:23S rRNA (guanosine2251-2'-O)-methyltransferase
MEIVVILNNIRSSENVGSIFRTADAVGVSKIILVGYTPAPVDRFGRENKGLTKASLGAEKTVKWEKAENISDAIEKLKDDFSALSVIAVEQDKKSIDYRKIKNNKAKNIALVFGNEVEGLSKEDLKLCDVVAELPMRGFMVQQAHHPCNTKQGKESLNVSVCAGIILYSLITDRINN